MTRVASRPGTGGGSSGLSPGESAAAFSLGAIAVVSGAVWAAGEAAALLASGQPLRSGFAAAPGTLLRLSRHGSDPALAWPAADQILLPGPVAFYAVGTLALLLLVGSLLLALRIRSRFARDGGRERDARFALPRDLRSLRVRNAEPGRVTLGRVGSGLLAAEPRQSVLVVGPTQTGKTTGLAIPAILEWDGPVVATSIKTDLLRDTIAMRTARGRALVFDPASCTGLERASWTSLAAAATWAGALRVSASLVEAARPSSSGVEDPEFWLRLARKLLAPLLLAASVGELTIADVLRWVDTQDDSEPRWILESAGEAAALQALEASMNRDPKTRSGANATAETILEAYADPTVLAAAMTSEITPDVFLDGGANTLYLCAPAHEQRRLQPVFSALIAEIIDAATERSAATGEPLDPPLLLVLDECANIAPLRGLDALASSGAGQGIQLVTVFQDIAQITSVYGSERARTILANHRAKMLLAGITDPETLEHAARVIGDEPSREVSATRGSRGERSTTESTHYRSLMPPNALRQMRPGEALLLYGHIPPVRLRLRPWYRERSLRGMVPGRAGRNHRSRRGVLMAMIGALLTAVAATAFLLGSTSGHRPANHQVTTSSKFADLHRPLHLPRLAKGKACPIGKAQPAARLGHGFSRHMPAVGRGPVYPLTVGGAPAGTLSVEPGTGFWRGQKTPWIAARSYRGPVLIRGGRIDGLGAMRFAFTTGQRLPELRLPHDGATGTQPNGWRAWPSLTLVRAPGCYAYQIDGATFSRIIVIRATA